MKDDVGASHETLYQYDEEFRNSISTVDAEGKRVWIYPKKPSGIYHRWRIALTVFLLALFFTGPFIKLGGHPFLLLNIIERKFILFGQVFWPQDFFLLAIVAITFFVFIILFTVAFGRVWCGWACPQTLFMEMVFRKIEYWIEGDANDQRKLKSSPMTVSRAAKNIFKHFLFIVISVLIAHTVMAYLIGIDELKQIVTEPPTSHMAGFIGLTAFAVIFYGVYARFREQACTVVCPYGRLQSVLLVKDSIVVAYDWLRGEPRGKLKKSQPAESEKKGDCIDCKLCVHVCPTGIDIRHGTQLECVNCTACIDACDDVMVKIHKPKGLIRYSSHNAIKDGKIKLFTPRIAGYSLVLIALLSLLTFFISTRKDIEMTVLKAPGTLYSKTDDGQITNLYNIEFINKTFEDVPLELKIESPAGASFMRVGGPEIVVPKEGILKGLYMVKIPPELITSTKTIVQLSVFQNGKKITSNNVKFIGPLKKHL
ncbi:MAG TPA: cytochrome c oxidase accessory protein CcoG [Cyclobacteriaceae bacterium]|jgi:cytochrome c oxidase accessory protein FixG|nr:cytochrome c oxidase accessory protein CcoG [Cyclobacteriaceae bacterium]